MGADVRVEWADWRGGGEECVRSRGVGEGGGGKVSISPFSRRCVFPLSMPPSSQHHPACSLPAPPSTLYPGRENGPSRAAGDEE